MQAHSLEVFSLAKIVFYPKKFYYPLLLPSHNCINNHNVQFSRCIFKFLFQETQWSNDFSLLQSISWMMVESTGIEPVTSCLQGRRSPSWANPPYRDLPFSKWWAKMDSLSCGKATAVTTCRRHVVKSRLSSHFCLSDQQLCPFRFFLLFSLIWSGGPKWTRTIDLTIISRVL